MSKTIKILFVLLMVIVLTSVMTTVFAGSIDPSQVIPGTVDGSSALNIGKTILGWIRNIAAIASVVIIAILGLKFMIGSTEERAEYKKSFMPLIVGLLLVLAATTVAGWIWSAFSSL